MLGTNWLEHVGTLGSLMKSWFQRKHHGGTSNMENKHAIEDPHPAFKRTFFLLNVFFASTGVIPTKERTGRCHQHEELAVSGHLTGGTEMA